MEPQQWPSLILEYFLLCETRRVPALPYVYSPWLMSQNQKDDQEKSFSGLMVKAALHSRHGFNVEIICEQGFADHLDSSIRHTSVPRQLNKGHDSVTTCHTCMCTLGEDSLLRSAPRHGPCTGGGRNTTVFAAVAQKEMVKTRVMRSSFSYINQRLCLASPSQACRIANTPVVYSFPQVCLIWLTQCVNICNQKHTEHMSTSKKYPATSLTDRPNWLLKSVSV